MTIDRRLRVVVWSTGGIGSIAVAAVSRRPDLELVGVWVHSPEKVGRDAGEIGGGAPLGLLATDDAEALIALRPDCVVYSASGPERDAVAVPDYERLLEAGINVVTTTSTRLVFPPVYDQASRDRLAKAAEAGAPPSTHRVSSPASPRINSPSSCPRSRTPSAPSGQPRSRSTTTIRSLR